MLNKSNKPPISLQALLAVAFLSRTHFAVIQIHSVQNNKHALIHTVRNKVKLKHIKEFKPHLKSKF